MTVGNSVLVDSWIISESLLFCNTRIQLITVLFTNNRFTASSSRGGVRSRSCPSSPVISLFSVESQKNTVILQILNNRVYNKRDILIKAFLMMQLAIPVIQALYSQGLLDIITTKLSTPISHEFHHSPALAHNLCSSFSLTPSNKRLITRDSSEGKTKGNIT